MIINQYVNRFLNFCEYQGLNRKTIIRHEFNLKGFVKWNGDKPITKESLREFIVYQKNRKPRTKNGLSSREGLAIYSINSYIATLKKFVYYLWSEAGYLPEDLTGAIKSFKQKTFMPVLLTPYEIYSLINCPRQWDEHHSWVDRRKYDIFFELLACLGLRKFEALGLKVEDFNFKEGILRIAYGKGGKGRIIPIP